MNIPKLLVAAFSATNVMTTFSYLMAGKYKALFAEPVMLNFILHRLHLCIPGRFKKFTGWLAHYCIGLAFVFAYALLWRYAGIQFGWLSAFTFGVASAIIGMIGWTLIYRLPDKKPPVPLRDYYVQLFFAHIIFALVVVAACKVFDYDPVGKVRRELSAL